MPQLRKQSPHPQHALRRLRHDLPALMRLAPDELRFVVEFVKSSGSLKEMARKMGLSYPTVRNKLDDIITHLKTFEQHEATD